MISVPLIKTESGSQTALRSGQRSAILPTTGGCYRLKGCGHYLDDVDKLRLPYPSFSVSKIEVSKSFLNIQFYYSCHLVRVVMPQRSEVAVFLTPH